MKQRTTLVTALTLLALCSPVSPLQAAGNCSAKKHSDAVTMARNGHLKLARVQLEAVVSDCTTSQGAAHNDTLKAMESLINVYAEEGQWQRTIPLLQRILQARRSQLGEEDTQVLVMQNNLGMAYLQLGQWEEAEPLLEQVLAALTASAGAEAPDTLRVMNNLASVYSNQGKYAQVLPLQQKMLAGLQARLGKSHPLPLMVSHELAQTLQALGRPAEALELSRQVLQALQASEGQQDPRTLVAMSHLGALLLEQQQLEEARRLFEQALQLSADHKQADALQLRTYLAMLARQEGQHEQSNQQLQDVLTDASQTLGDPHPLVADVQLRLAEGYYQAGQPQLGWPLLQASHNNMLALYGAQHPQVLASLPLLLAGAQQQNVIPETLYLFGFQVLQQAEGQLDEARKLLKIAR